MGVTQPLAQRWGRNGPITTPPIFCFGSFAPPKAIHIGDPSPDDHADPTADERADSTADDRAVSAENRADFTANGRADAIASARGPFSSDLIMAGID